MTDHTEEARFLIERLEKQVAPTDVSENLKLAHVHAMLAVAEQQRVMNLILLNTHFTSGLYSYDSPLWKLNTGDSFSAQYEIRPEIAALLGMKPKEETDGPH